MDTLLLWAAKLVRLGGPVTVIVAAQLFLKPKSENAAKWVTLGGALAVVSPAWDIADTLLRGLPFIPVVTALLHAAWPVLTAAAVAGIAWGVMVLLDEANPPKVTLPPALQNVKAGGANKFALGFWFVLGVLFVFGSSRTYGESSGALETMGVSYQVSRWLTPLGFVAALALVQFAGWWLQKNEGLAKWLLTRRPQDVLWSYTHQLTVKRNGVVTGVHWSAQVSSASGYRVGLPASGQEHAQSLVVAVAQHCPGVLLGFSPENAAAYLAKRKALEAQPAPAVAPTTLR